MIVDKIEMKKIFSKLFSKTKPTHTALLYGLQRSGTTYLQTLMEKNYPEVDFINHEFRKNPAHKHFRLYDNKTYIPEPNYMNSVYLKSMQEFENLLEKQPDVYIVISKDPYSWYLSYLKWAKKHNWNTPEYHYIEEWNLFYGKWLEFSKQTDNILFIKYIDLLADPEKELCRIALTLNIPPVTKIISPEKVNSSKRFTASSAKYYLDREYLKAFSEEELITLQNLVDKNVMEELGYEYKNILP